MQHSEEEKRAFFQSLHTLRQRKKEGTFREILEDWRWIFSYTRRHKTAAVGRIPRGKVGPAPRGRIRRRR